MRRRLAALAALTVIAMAGAAAWALLGSGLFAVRAFVVTGTHLVPDSEVLAVAGVRPGTPLIQVNTAQVAARVLTIRQVAGVQVATSWPDRVIIVVRERTAALAVALPGGGFDLIDGGGVVLRQAQARPPACRCTPPRPPRPWPATRPSPRRRPCSANCPPRYAPP